jgi:uncharacterized protein
MLPPIEHRIAEELGVRPPQVFAAVRLLDEGATVPFIARYRKEVTDSLDDTQLRTLEERLGYLRELEERRAAVLASIDEQGKLSPELKNDIENADTKQRLEDLYLPYKPKRRTKAQIAREAGLEPLADALFNDPTRIPEAEAAKYVNTATEPPEQHVPDIKAALDGARQILMERFAEDAALLARLRTHLHDHALIVSAVIDGKQDAGAKFRDWFDFREKIADIPSHRALALLRGRQEDVLRLSLKTEQELRDPPDSSPCIAMVSGRFGLRDQGRAADKWLLETARWTWLVKLSLHLELELMNALRERAEEEAIRVFARNLHDLLLAAPAGPRVTHRPRSRHPHRLQGRRGRPHRQAARHGNALPARAATRLGRFARRAAPLLCQKHGVALIAIGNGTASRETDKLAAELMKRHARAQADEDRGLGSRRLGLFRVRAGGAEFPALDVSACAAPSPSPAACRTRSPSWSRSIPRASASASTSTMSIRSKLARRSTPSSRIA